MSAGAAVKVVVLGGGNGISVVLEGLARRARSQSRLDITAIVATADDGGKLRTDPQPTRRPPSGETSVDACWRCRHRQTNRWPRYSPTATTVTESSAVTRSVT